MGTLLDKLKEKAGVSTAISSGPTGGGYVTTAPTTTKSTTVTPSNIPSIVLSGPTGGGSYKSAPTKTVNTTNQNVDQTNQDTGGYNLSYPNFFPNMFTGVRDWANDKYDQSQAAQWGQNNPYNMTIEGGWVDPNAKARWESSVDQLDPTAYGNVINQQLNDWGQYGPAGQRYAGIEGGLNYFNPNTAMNTWSWNTAGYGQTPTVTGSYGNTQPAGGYTPYNPYTAAYGGYNQGGGYPQISFPTSPTGSGPGIDRSQTGTRQVPTSALQSPTGSGVGIDRTIKTAPGITLPANTTGNSIIPWEQQAMDDYNKRIANAKVETTALGHKKYVDPNTGRTIAQPVLMDWGFGPA